MKYAYYPGCSLLGSSAEYARSGEAVLAALGVELEEVDDWVCCGATAAHATSHLLSVALPAVNCAEAEKKGLDVLTCCAACYSRLKQANQEVKEDPELQAQISEIIEEPYQGNVRVLHISEVLATELDPEVLKALLPLGRKVGTGPPEVLNRLVQVSSLQPLQGGRGLGVGEFLQALPQPFMERQAGPECGDLREDGVVRSPELRGLRHRNEVRSGRGAPRQTLDDPVQS